jgi:hypothetical protein
MNDSFLGHESIPLGFQLKDVFKSLLFRFQAESSGEDGKSRSRLVGNQPALEQDTGHTCSSTIMKSCLNC